MVLSVLFRSQTGKNHSSNEGSRVCFPEKKSNKKQPPILAAFIYDMHSNISSWPPKMCSLPSKIPSSLPNNCGWLCAWQWCS